jgi:hypothetical protein
MKSFRQVEQIVGQARLRADPATDARVLGDADVALAETMNNRPSARRPGPALWRTIVNSKATRIPLPLRLSSPACWSSGTRWISGAVRRRTGRGRAEAQRNPPWHKRKARHLAARRGQTLLAGRSANTSRRISDSSEEQYDRTAVSCTGSTSSKSNNRPSRIPADQGYIRSPPERSMKTCANGHPTGLVNYHSAAYGEAGPLPVRGF